MPTQRTALLIRCSNEEAARIRSEAKKERRTLSGYVINALMNRMESREKALARWEFGLQGDPSRSDQKT